MRAPRLPVDKEKWVPPARHIRCRACKAPAGVREFPPITKLGDEYVHDGKCPDKKAVRDALVFYEGEAVAKILEQSYVRLDKPH